MHRFDRTHPLILRAQKKSTTGGLKEKRPKPVSFYGGRGEGLVNSCGDGKTKNSIDQNLFSSSSTSISERGGRGPSSPLFASSSLHLS